MKFKYEFVKSIATLSDRNRKKWQAWNLENYIGLNIFEIRYIKNKTLVRSLVFNCI